jgi:CTP:molybdopterin cytidylyltransferase MocA
LLDELLQLEGDEGARAVITRHRAQLQLIDCGDAGVVYDIDRPEDLPQDSSR